MCIFDVAIIQTTNFVCNVLLFGSQWSVLSHDLNELLVVELAIVVDVGLLPELGKLLVAQPLSESCRDRLELLGLDESIVVSVEDLEGFLESLAGLWLGVSKSIFFLENQTIQLTKYSTYLHFQLRVFGLKAIFLSTFCFVFLSCYEKSRLMLLQKAPK